MNFKYVLAITAGQENERKLVYRDHLFELNVSSSDSDYIDSEARFPHITYQSIKKKKNTILTPFQRTR